MDNTAEKHHHKELIVYNDPSVKYQDTEVTLFGVVLKSI